MSAPSSTASAPRQARTAPRGTVRLARGLLACVTLCALAACSTLGIAPLPYPGRGPSQSPEESDAPSSESLPGAPSRPRSDSSSATQELLQQSRAARAAGNYGQATATTERALRIDPNNPALWLELGEIALANGETKQAATLARKALSLAAGDRAVTAQAERLLRAAGTR
jgi:tetratricopeptide (TPR) repeat protein